MSSEHQEFQGNNNNNAEPASGNPLANAPPSLYTPTSEEEASLAASRDFMAKLPNQKPLSKAEKKRIDSPLASPKRTPLKHKNPQTSVVEKSPIRHLVDIRRRARGKRSMNSIGAKRAGYYLLSSDSSLSSQTDGEERVSYQRAVKNRTRSLDGCAYEVLPPDKQFKRDLRLSANAFRDKIMDLGVDHLNADEAMRLLREIQDEPDDLGVPRDQAEVIAQLLNSNQPVEAVLMPDLNEGRRGRNQNCKRAGSWVAVIMCGALGFATVVSVPFFVLGTIAQMWTGNPNLSFKDIMSLENKAIYAVGVPAGILGWLGLAPFFGYNLYKTGQGFANASWKQKLFSIGIHAVGFVTAAGLGNGYFIQNFWEGVSSKVPVSDAAIHGYTWGSIVVTSIGNVEGVKFFASQEFPRTARWLVNMLQSAYHHLSKRGRRYRRFNFFPNADNPSVLERKEVLSHLRRLADYMADIYDVGMSSERINREKQYHQAMPQGADATELKNILAYLQGVDQGYPSVRMGIFRGVFEPLSLLLAVAGNYNFLYQGKEVFDYLFKIGNENNLGKAFGGLTFIWSSVLWYFLLRNMFKDFVRPTSGRCGWKDITLEYLLPLAPAATLAVTNIFLTFNNPELDNFLVKFGVMSAATLGGFLLSRFGIANGLRDALAFKDRRLELMGFSNTMYQYFKALPDDQLFESYTLLEPYVNKLGGLEEERPLLEGYRSATHDDVLNVSNHANGDVAVDFDTSLSSDFEVEEQSPTSRCVIC